MQTRRKKWRGDWSGDGEGMEIVEKGTEKGTHEEMGEAVDTAGAGWCFPWKNPLRDTFCDFQRVFPMETQKVFLKEKSKKHIMCFFQVFHR